MSDDRPGLLQELAEAFPPEHVGARSDQVMRRLGVVAGAEFRRIMALPRRESPTIDPVLLTRWLKTPNGSLSLREKQAQALAEIHDFGGLFGMMSPGSGKTAVSLLAPVVREEIQRPILLVPAALQKKALEKDIPFYRQHFRMHPNLRVLSNQLLQTPKNQDLLKRYMPDMIVLDEAHEYRNKTAARTLRLLKYLREYPDTILVVLSGTLMKRSLKDFWHLIKLTHKPKRVTSTDPDQPVREIDPCPLPRSWNELSQWADAIDEGVPDARRVEPGVLMKFCKDGENARQGLQRRIIQSPGVVATQKIDCDSSLNILQRPTPVIPPIILQAFEQMRRSNATLAGDELTDQMNVWRRGKEMAYGFYYRWNWPENKPDQEWLDKRRSWRRFVRETIEDNARYGLDSEKKVRDACIAGKKNPELWNAWAGVARRWHPHPPRQTVWLSDYLLQDAAKFDGGVIWVEHVPVGEKLSQMTGRPFFHGGNAEEIINYKGPCIASVAACGKGFNLQQYDNALLLCCPSGGDVFDQLLARHHRDGQQSDEVNFHIYVHCREIADAFQKARNDAACLQDVTSQEQRLNIATISTPSEWDVENWAATGDPLWRRKRQ